MKRRFNATYLYSKNATRKFFLFAGAANLYTLIGTAQLNGVNSETYRRYALTHIAFYPISRC